MQYGMYIAASGALNSMYRQNVAANNLANLNTVGFKSDLPLTRQRDPARIEDSLPHKPSNELLEALGAGVMAMPSHTKHGQGALTETGNPLDLALQGDGFFVVRSKTGEEGDSLRLTRDGRFTLDARGRMVTQDGMPVMGVGNRPIDLDGRLQVTVDPDGAIRQNGNIVARLQVIEVADRQSMRKAGASLFVPPSDTLMNATPSRAIVRQNSIEESQVDPISAMMAVQGAGRDVESNIGMISRYDQMLDRAINGFARLA